MNTTSVLRTLLAVSTLGAAGLAQAGATTASAVTAGFENGLSAWFDRNPANPDAVIVNDPLRAGNHVLAFSTIMGSGSVFTNAAVSTGGSFTLSFDYLGLPGQGSNPADTGGYIGVSVGGNGSQQFWIGGTSDNYGTPLNLIDDGQWHSYSYTFSAAGVGFAAGQALRVMVEDWDGSGGVAGDAFFDNIVLRDSSVTVATPALGANAVPEPGSLGLVGSALALVAVAGWATRGRRV